MHRSTRLILGGILSGVALVCAVLATLGPIRISVSLDQGAAAAAPAADIPTGTPPPPTEAPTQPPALPTDLPTAWPTDAPTATSMPTDLPAATPAPTDLPATTPRSKEKQHKETTPIPVITPPPVATITPLPNVTIAKTADRAAALPGQQIIFTLIARNTGAAPAYDVVVSDAVPAGLRVIDLASTKGDVVVAGQNVSAYPAVLEAGEAVEIRITVELLPGVTNCELRNTAMITSGTPGDDPADNTSSVVVQVQQLLATPQARVQRLPVTADPEPPQALALYGPWMLLALMVALMGVAVRFGMFRQRSVTVMLGAPTRLPANEESNGRIPPQEALRVVEGIMLDPSDLMRQWRGGVTVARLTDDLAQQHPQASRLMILLAVQRLIDEQIGR